MVTVERRAQGYRHFESATLPQAMPVTDAEEKIAQYRHLLWRSQRGELSPEMVKALGYEGKPDLLLQDLTESIGHLEKLIKTPDGVPEVKILSIKFELVAEEGKLM